MTERLYHYSLIRYVPRPVAEEFVNVGVVAVSDTGDEASVEFTDDWTRARALGGREEDVLMLRRLARAWLDESYDLPLFPEAAGDEHGAARLNRLYETSANKVQFSRPNRGLASSIDEIVDEVYDSLIASAPKVRTRRPTSPSKSPSRNIASAVGGPAKRGRGSTAGGGRASTTTAARRKRATTTRSGTRTRSKKASTTAPTKRKTTARSRTAKKRATSSRKRGTKTRGPSAKSRATSRRGLAARARRR
jgi:hypothetical protein